MQTAKAWTSAVSVLVLFAIARFAGVGEMPPIEDLEQALVEIAKALIAAAVAGGMTWLVPNKPAP